MPSPSFTNDLPMLYDKLNVSEAFWSVEENYSPKDEGRVPPKRKALQLINHLPRSIRARVARASAHNTKNHKRRTSSSDGSGSPHQEGARSPTGRVALGPWTGPFEAHPGSPTSSSLTLYLDMDGHCYESLARDRSKEADSAQSSKRGHMIVRSQHSHLNAMLAEVMAAKAAAALATSPAMTPQMMMMVDGAGSNRRHAHQATHAPAQWAPARGQRTRKMMAISQPRSSYH